MLVSPAAVQREVVLLKKYNTVFHMMPALDVPVFDADSG
jgi:hypothetical protein